MLTILTIWAACGLIVAAAMSRVLSHARVMTREQRKLNH
jgi:hypothetical protein